MNQTPTTLRSQGGLTAAAKAAFKEYFTNVSQNPTKAKREEFAQQFGLTSQESVRGWFQRERKRLKIPQSTTQTSLQGTGTTFSEQPAERDIDSEEEAAKIEFDYLKEEHIIRLHSIFKEKRLNPKFTPQLAKQLKLPEHVIVEFARWMAQREQRELDSYSTGNNTPQSSVPPQFHSVSPSRTSPQTPGSAQHSPIKMEIDEAAASLPTPQGSVEPNIDRSPPPRASSPGFNINHQTFYNTWLQSRAASLPMTISVLPNERPSNILQMHLPSSVAHFAFGSTNAA